MCGGWVKWQSRNRPRVRGDSGFDGMDGAVEGRGLQL